MGLVVDEAGLEPFAGALARTSADVTFSCGDDILTGPEVLLGVIPTNGFVLSAWYSVLKKNFQGHNHYP